LPTPDAPGWVRVATLPTIRGTASLENSCGWTPQNFEEAVDLREPVLTLERVLILEYFDGDDGVGVGDVLRDVEADHTVERATRGDDRSKCGQRFLKPFGRGLGAKPQDDHGTCLVIAARRAIAAEREAPAPVPHYERVAGLAGREGGGRLRPLGFAGLTLTFGRKRFSGS
jgi:hypothetical protein